MFSITKAILKGKLFYQGFIWPRGRATGWLQLHLDLLSHVKGEKKSTINQLDIINICRIFNPTTAKKYTYFSGSHKILTKKDHILGDKTHLNKFKRVESIQSILSDHMELNQKSITERCKISNYLKIKQIHS